MVIKTGNYIIEKIDYWDTQVFKLDSTYGFKIYIPFQEQPEQHWLLIDCWVDFEDLHEFTFMEMDQKIESLLKMKAFW
jgi:hypothetical protein